MYINQHTHIEKRYKMQILELWQRAKELCSLLHVWSGLTDCLDLVDERIPFLQPFHPWFVETGIEIEWVTSILNLSISDLNLDDYYIPCTRNDHAVGYHNHGKNLWNRAWNICRPNNPYLGRIDECHQSVYTPIPHFFHIWCKNAIADLCTFVLQLVHLVA